MAASTKKGKGKGDDAEKLVLFGRPKNNLAMGVVGLPNVGKSSLFNVLGKAQSESANYAFCTTEPHETKAPVPDRNFDWLCELFQPASQVRAVLTVWDIAGLVKGAAEGEGLGNAFLSHISAVDGIFHVVRCFDDPMVTHVEDTVDPVRDLTIITDELRRKDIQHMKKLMPDLKRLAAHTDKSKQRDLDVGERVMELLEEGKDIRSQPWTANEVESINTFYLLSAKPVIYLANLSPRDYIRKRNKWLAPVAEWVKEHGDEPLIPFSASFEAEVAAIEDPAERAAFLKEKKTTSAMPKIVRSGYNHLNLINFYTTGADEVRAWTIRRGTKAPQAAGVIHTDFEKGFICADVIPFDALKEHGSEAGAKAKGQLRTQGKEYVVQPLDCIFFKFNASGGGKKKK